MNSDKPEGLSFPDRPNLKKMLRFQLSLYPFLFYPLYQLQGKQSDLATCKHTDIVIEGYPRSANSFSVGAFRSTQIKPVCIAHHLHSPAQIIRGVRLKKPTLLLIRSPYDAVISYQSLALQAMEFQGKADRKVDINISQSLKHWIKFYSRVLSYREGFIIGLFSEVTQDFASIIARINAKYNTKFSLFSHSSESVNNVHISLGYHAGPSARRDELKELVQRQFNSKNMHILLRDAEELYANYAELANQQMRELT